MKNVVAILIATMMLATLIPVFAQQELPDQPMPEPMNQINAVGNMVNATDEGMNIPAEENTQDDEGLKTE